jgi:hypothetical protein
MVVPTEFSESGGLSVLAYSSRKLGTYTFDFELCRPPLLAQQKPQWMPGQIGLNAGILPSPGFTYVNMDINYEAGAFNDRNGNAVHVSGTYNVWALDRGASWGFSKVYNHASLVASSKVTCKLPRRP